MKGWSQGWLLIGWVGYMISNFLETSYLQFPLWKVGSEASATKKAHFHKNFIEIATIIYLNIL